MLNKKIMKLALEYAKKTTLDIPVCAIVTKNDEIISIKTNEREKNKLITSHAEILALNDANKKLESLRLDDCDIYVTLEPCPMCAWAIINSKIKNVYFASFDINYGAFGGAINLAQLANSKINIYGGIMEEESSAILKNYFKELRNEKSAGCLS